MTTVEKVQKERMKSRQVKVGLYIVVNQATTRETAAEFDVSSSTILRDVKKLKDMAPKLYKLVMKVFEANNSKKEVDDWEITGVRYGRRHLYNKDTGKTMCGREIKAIVESDEIEEITCNQCARNMLGIGLVGEFLE